MNQVKQMLIMSFAAAICALISRFYIPTDFGMYMSGFFSSLSISQLIIFYVFRKYSVHEPEIQYYLEAHVTIEPIFDERLEEAKRISRKYKFKVADLLMKKRESDTEERSKHDTFMTGHSKNYQDIQDRITGLINELNDNGFKVWRYKIEDTLIDSKMSDKLALFL